MMRASPSGVLYGKADLSSTQLISSDFFEHGGTPLAQYFHNVCKKIQRLGKHSCLWLGKWVTALTIIALWVVSLQVLKNGLAFGYQT